MDLTLLRHEDRPPVVVRRPRAVAVATGPAGVLVASCALAAAFLLALADLVSRLG